MLIKKQMPTSRKPLWGYVSEKINVMDNWEILRGYFSKKMNDIDKQEIRKYLNL